MSAKPPNLTSIGIVKDLAAALNASEANSKFAGLPKGSLRGTVVDVNDPEERGRVKVIFDDMNPSVPQVTGAGEWSEERKGEKPDASHWIDTSPAFKGKQPPGLVGKRVNINASNGQYQYAILQDVLHDPELLATNAKDKPEMPNNSSMTRLPCYPSGLLPPASQENHGCMVVESGGPMQSDWLCVCLQRNGSYFWVRHIDAAHGHAGQNDSTERPDSDGDAMAPINNATTWDYTFPTTAGPMEKYSSYGTDPRPNPFGGEATHLGGAS
jgi:hypothetical protein